MKKYIWQFLIFKRVGLTSKLELQNVECEQSWPQDNVIGSKIA